MKGGLIFYLDAQESIENLNKYFPMTLQCVGQTASWSGPMLMCVVHPWYASIVSQHMATLHILELKLQQKKAFKNRNISELRYWALTLRGQFFFFLPIQLSLYIDLFLLLNILNLI